MFGKIFPVTTPLIFNLLSSNFRQPFNPPIKQKGITKEEIKESCYRSFSFFFCIFIPPGDTDRIFATKAELAFIQFFTMFQIIKMAALPVFRLIVAPSRIRPSM